MEKFRKPFAFLVTFFCALVLLAGCASPDPSDPVPVLYNVTFESNGGSTVAPLENVAEHAKITPPNAPVKDDSWFKGWFLDETCQTKWNFSSDTVTKNITLYAGWTLKGEPVTGANAVENIADRTAPGGTLLSRPFWNPDAANSWEAAPNSGGKAFKPQLAGDGSLFFTGNMQANFQLFRILTKESEQRFDNLGATFHDHSPDNSIFNREYQYTFMLKTETDFKIAMFGRSTTNLTTGAGAWIRLAHDPVNGLNIQTARGNINNLPQGSTAPVPLARASDDVSGYQKGEWNRVDMIFSRDTGGMVNGAPSVGYMTMKLYINGHRVAFSATEKLNAEKNLSYSFANNPLFEPVSYTVDAASLDANGNFVWCILTPAAAGKPNSQEIGFGQRFIVETDSNMSLSLKKFTP